MHWKKFDATNINTIVTIIAIIVGIPSFYVAAVGNLTLVNALAFSSVFLLILLLISMYANNNIIKRFREAETEVTTWKDRSSNYQDRATSLDQELNQCKNDYQNSTTASLEQQTKLENLRIAYIRLRYAYKKAKGITTHDISIGTSVQSVTENSREHLQQIGELELYISAEQMAQSAGVLDDA
jgi:hypothetical protein